MISISNLFTRCDNLEDTTHFDVIDIITGELMGAGTFWDIKDIRNYEVLQFELGTKNNVTILSIRPEALDIYEKRERLE